MQVQICTSRMVHLHTWKRKALLILSSHLFTSHICEHLEVTVAPKREVEIDR